MALLTRDQILKAKVPTKVVSVPEWGGDVSIIRMTAGARDELGEAFIKAKEEGRSTPPNLRCRMVALSLVDKTGKPLFSLEDVEALAKTEGAAIDRIYSEITEFNALGENAIEEAAKN